MVFALFSSEHKLPDDNICHDSQYLTKLFGCRALLEEVEAESNTNAYSANHFDALSARLRFPEDTTHMQDAVGESKYQQHGKDQRGGHRWHMRGQRCAWLESGGL